MWYSVDVCGWFVYYFVVLRGFLRTLSVDAMFSLTWIFLIDYRWIYFGKELATE